MKKRILMALFAVAVLMMDIQMVHAEEMVAAPEETAEVEAVGAEGEHISSEGFTFTLDSLSNATITGYKGVGENVTVPATIKDETGAYKVRTIASLAFENNNLVRTIIVEEGVENVGQAFDGCSNLVSVNLPSSVVYVADEAFNNSCILESINVADDNRRYFSRNGVLFSNHDNEFYLQTYPAGKKDAEYIIDKDIYGIKSGAFIYTTQLQKVTIDENISSILMTAFCSPKIPLTIHIKSESCNDIANNFAMKAFREFPDGSKIIVKNSAVAEEMKKHIYLCEGTQIISLENDPSYRKAATDLRFTADESNTKNMIIGVGDVDTRLRTSYTISPADTTDNVTWEVTEGENIAKVDPVSGCITGLETGDCKIVGKDESGHSLTVNLTVYKAVDSVKIGYPRTGTIDMVYGEQNNKLDAKVFVTPLNANNSANIIWKSSNKAVAMVSASEGPQISDSYYTGRAKVMIKGAGSATITATVDDNGTYHTASFVVNVTKPLVNVDTLSVSSIKAQTYTGKAITPAITVKDGSKVLKSGTDYTVSYKGNVNPGTAAVTIKGIGSYTGERSVSFKIEKKNSGSAAKQISKTTISGIKTKTYTGKAITQAVTVRDGSKVLKAGTDYTVSYKGNKNAGKASVIITGKNGYTGSVTKYFTIRKADQKIKAASSYKKPYGSKAFTVSAKRTAGKGKLTYKSSNKKVAAVNGKGKVAIKGTGIAVITVTAEGNTNYNKKAVKITITSAPKQEKLVTVKSRSKKKLEVKWSKDTRATGYEVQYSTSSKFKSKTTKTVQIRKNKITGQTIKKLKSGKKYYVRVRAYKKCGKKKLCGQWSKVKNVKIR